MFDIIRQIKLKDHPRSLLPQTNIYSKFIWNFTQKFRLPPLESWKPSPPLHLLSLIDNPFCCKLIKLGRLHQKGFWSFWNICKDFSNQNQMKLALVIFEFISKALSHQEVWNVTYIYCKLIKVFPLHLWMKKAGAHPMI